MPGLVFMAVLTLMFSVGMFVVFTDGKIVKKYDMTAILLGCLIYACTFAVPSFFLALLIQAVTQ